MLIAKVTISYDRGIERNDKKHLGLKEAPTVTEDGRIIRGLGTHFKSEGDMKIVQERDRENNRIRFALRSRFLTMPIDGIYMAPSRGAVAGFVKELCVRKDVTVRVTEFNLESVGGLDGAELAEWAERIKRQLSGISLGRSKEADEEGLRCLETLASCPIIKRATGNRIKEMVASVRAQKLDRIELKRSLETLNVEIDPTPMEAVEPRRPALAA